MARESEDEHRLDRWLGYVVSAQARGLDAYQARAEAAWRMGDEPLAVWHRYNLHPSTVELYPREQQ